MVAAVIPPKIGVWKVPVIEPVPDSITNLALVVAPNNEPALVVNVALAAVVLQITLPSRVVNVTAGPPGTDETVNVVKLLITET